MNNLRSLRYSPKCTFQRFVAFLWKDGTENEESEGKKILTINPRVFLAIKPSLEPLIQSENNYMNKCIKLRPLSPLVPIFSKCLRMYRRTL